ncbi:MAG: hypothetical protein JXA22_08185 [Candidatus Thermoplasmatota archaeon]|nr:hypothetical protein [Candidatus Thermoplasmatota archaeon]
MAAPVKYTPVQGFPSTRNRRGIPTVPILVMAIYLVYLGVFIVAPKFVSRLDEELGSMFPPLWRLVGAVVLFIVFAIVLVVNLMTRSTPEPPVQQRIQVTKAANVPPLPQGPPRFKPVVTDKQPVKTPKPAGTGVNIPARSQVIVYPQEVEGGIFGDTYIGIGTNKVLKLRSLVVEPEYLA